MGVGQVRALTTLPPGKEPPVAIGLKVGWASKPFWKRWQREDIPDFDSNRTPVV